MPGESETPATRGGAARETASKPGVRGLLDIGPFRYEHVDALVRRVSSSRPGSGSGGRAKAPGTCTLASASSGQTAAALDQSVAAGRKAPRVRRPRRSETPRSANAHPRPRTIRSRSSAGSRTCRGWLRRTIRSASRRRSSLGSRELVGVRVFPDPYGDTRLLADGRYRLRVRVWDVAGNSAEADSDVTIRN